jgi:hypothetical protein
VFFAELGAAVLVALVIAAGFAVGFGRRLLGVGLGLAFVVVFLVARASGVSVTPLLPAVRGVSWLIFLLVGILIGFLMGTMMPTDRRPHTRGEALRQADARQRVTTVFNLAFSALVIIALLIVVAVHYLR